MSCYLMGRAAVLVARERIMNSKTKIGACQASVDISDDNNKGESAVIVVTRLSVVDVKYMATMKTERAQH